MTQIDKHIALPTPRNNYPLGDLEIGDSFFIPDSTTLKICNVITKWRKYHKSEKKFTTRAINKGVRIWRIK